jgi:hypothetical protein
MGLWARVAGNGIAEGLGGAVLNRGEARVAMMTLMTTMTTMTTMTMVRMNRAVIVGVLSILWVQFLRVQFLCELCAAEEPKEPSLEELIKLNAEPLFGAKPDFGDGGKVTLVLTGDGSFEKGFVCRGVGGSGIIASAPALRNEAVRKTLLEGAAGAFSFAGLISGSAVSKFELSGDFKVSFKLRIPQLSPQARIGMSFHQEGRHAIQTNFFQDVLVLAKKRASARSPDPRFAAPAASWFDRKSVGVPVEVSFQNSRFAIRMPSVAHDDKGADRGGKDQKGGKREKKPEEHKPEAELVEVVSLEGIDDPQSGRIALNFDKVSFLVSDFRVEGKLNRSWAEREIDALRKTGKLRTSDGAKKSEEDKPAVAGGDAPASKKGSGKKGPDLSKPDPEAKDDL